MKDDFGSDVNQVREGRASVAYVNEAGVPEEVAQAVVRSQDISSAIEKWSSGLRSGAQASRSWDLFNRAAYSHNGNVFGTFAALHRAVEHDDILSTLADTIERIAITKTKFEMYDNDQEDCWNQIADGLQLETRLREMWREIFKISQVYVGVWWEQKTFKVRTKPVAEDFVIQPPLGPDPVTGIVPDPSEIIAKQEEGKTKRKGNRTRKKQFAVEVPTAFTIFDPTKVIPVGTLMFNRERFAYCASRGEDENFSKVFNQDAPLVDETVLKLIAGKYRPTAEERAFCTANEVDPDRLWLFNEDACFRHTLTRPQYQRYSDCRLKSTLELLDMKAHLRASDRSALIGATNFIVVIRKGSDKIPARQAEIENLQEQAKVVARMPILVGDHRLQVDIVTPSTDNTLAADRYDTIDNRLIFRALTGFTLPKSGGGLGGGDEKTLAHVVARGMESMRAELMTTIGRRVYQAVLDKNPGVLDEFPKSAFTPRRVSLDINVDVINAMLKLRDRGDLSRQTTLEEVDFDQDVEALRRSREREVYDAVFTSIVPFSSPDATPFQSGSQGGRPAGSTAANGAKKPKPAADKAELDVE